ncbi:DUF1549 and DUF1553 domain-containing protein [Singulisphaera sp. PoT]|uniref:DUF1549 and DUF1553 domain-containing protein n=1 Tax=Singulisphaera sp. PoT TaxID=3411797 RepID=UPI003BF57224
MPTKPPATFQVSPSQLTLQSDDWGWQMLLAPIGKPGDSGQVVGGQVTWTVEPADIVALDTEGYVRPLKPGKARLIAHHQGEEAVSEVTVNAKDDRAWDFGQDIVPILTRTGCNTGGCHGKAEGQNGFHLSLYGYDAEGDFQSITRDASGRRLSRLDPSRSLLLEKATGRVPHVGGLRFTPQSPEYSTILSWIRAGAPQTHGKTHGEIAKLEVEPSDIRLANPGPIQLRVVAVYGDGTRRDVTRLSNFRVNDDASLKIDSKGKAEILRRAESDLVVRYQSMVVSTRLATLINPGLKFDYAKLSRRNFIDDELFKRLESLKVPPSPPASDSAFLRRVSLDLVGRQPTPEQVRQFVGDKDPDKRVKLVDKLLADRDFVRFWRIKFGDMLQISNARLGNGATRFQAWVDENLANNTPWDQMVRTMLTAVGAPEEFGNGPANYALDGLDAKIQAEQTAQRFLGLRIRCAQCHDHPFDVWTQDDYFGLAACFAKVERSGGGGMMGKTVIKINSGGKVEHLRTKKPAEPRLLDKKPVQVAEKEDPRKPLAEWITGPDNPYFARAMANWVWAQFFGKGLADPADDLSRANPPVHPELLDALARHFVKSKYDMRDLIRTVAISEAYGLSSGTISGNEKDTRLFSHHVARPLSAHQMADALALVTDVPNRYPRRANGTRAIEVADPGTASTILDTFGRCPRTNGCSSVSTPPLSLRQSLLLIGGDAIEGKVSHLNGYLANLLDLKPEPDEVVENLYLRTLCRTPTEEELSRWSAELKQAPVFREAAEDLFWALLNSREFAFNH